MHPVRRLAAACTEADLAAVESCLATDVVAVCDGSRVAVVAGPADVALFLVGLLAPAELTVESVNGQPGIVARTPEGTAQAVVVTDGVTTLWVVLTPAKLTRWHRP